MQFDKSKCNRGYRFDERRQINENCRLGLAEQMVKWAPCGVGRIRVRLKNRLEVVFTYYDDETWSLETNKKRR